VQGLGTVGGFKLELEIGPGLGKGSCLKASAGLDGQGLSGPRLAGLFSSYQINVPQLFADVDREKAKRQGIVLTDLFQTLQVYLGSIYVNDFNRFGRTYQVIAQATRRSGPRRQPRAAQGAQRGGEMIPLGSVLTVKQSYGPDRVLHYNAYPAADINGGPAQGTSSGEAIAIMERLATRCCLMGSRWSGPT
jgi:multidrug efflux pump subunit AcrB